MKAKGHHHIPRFLLNRFASRQAGSEYYTWVFRAGRDPIESNTRDVAKQKFFHGDPAVSSLESTIAEKETEFAALLQRVHAAGIDTNDVSRVRELIVHLTVRTKNLRDGFAQLEHDFFDVAEEKLTATDKKSRRRARQALMKAFYDELQKPELKNLLSCLPARRRKALIAMAKARAGKLDIASEAFSFFELFRDHLPGAVVESARNAHLKALNEDIAPEKRVANLSPLSWTVLRAKDGQLVLGDLGVIGRVQGNGGFVHPVTADADCPPTAMILPIAPDAAILGSMTTMDQITAGELNRASVELSRDFFISHRSTDTERGLVPYLARRSQLFSKDQLRQMIES